MQIRLFKDIVVKDIIRSHDLHIALALTAALTFVLCLYTPPSDKQSYFSMLLALYMTVGTALFGIVSATYAIFTGLTEPKFLMFLDKVKALKAYVSAFNVTAFASLYAVVAALITQILFMSKLGPMLPFWAKQAIHAADLLLILYAICSSIMIVGVISNYLGHRTKFYLEVFGLEDTEVRDIFEEMDRNAAEAAEAARR